MKIEEIDKIQRYKENNESEINKIMSTVAVFKFSSKTCEKHEQDKSKV